MEVSKRALSAKERGRKGGLATARNSTPEFLETRSRIAGSSTRDKYGIGYYRYLRTLRSKVKTPQEKLIQTIIPPTVSLPGTPIDLMAAAAKTIA